MSAAQQALVQMQKMKTAAAAAEHSLTAQLWNCDGTDISSDSATLASENWGVGQSQAEQDDDKRLLSQISSAIGSVAGLSVDIAAVPGSRMSGKTHKSHLGQGSMSHKVVRHVVETTSPNIARHGLGSTMQRLCI